MDNKKTLKWISLLTVTSICFMPSQILFAKKTPTLFSAKYSVFSKDKTQLIYLSQRSSQEAELVKINSNNGKLIKTAKFFKIRQLKPFAATPDGFKILANTKKGIAVIHNGTAKVLRTLPYPKPENRDVSGNTC